LSGYCARYPICSAIAACQQQYVIPVLSRQQITVGGA
jgi:hypothetical protein